MQRATVCRSSERTLSGNKRNQVALNGLYEWPRGLQPPTYSNYTGINLSYVPNLPETSRQEAHAEHQSGAGALPVSYNSCILAALSC
jgi:hypothetical protein